MADNDKDIAILNSLTQTVYDSVKGYETSSRDVDSPSVRTLFHEGAKDRSEVAHMLRNEVTRLGGEPADSPSMLGGAHQAFMKLREMVSTREDKAIIDEVERGEDYIKEKFEAAIANGDLSASSRAIVQQAYAKVKMGHDRARDLKRATN